VAHMQNMTPARSMMAATRRERKVPSDIGPV
jgi:hypothetical protein